MVRNRLRKLVVLALALALLPMLGCVAPLLAELFYIVGPFLLY